MSLPSMSPLTSAGTRATLEALARAGEATSKELADMTRNKHARTHIYRFAERGYVTRSGTRAVADKRGNLHPCAVWQITPAGRRALAARDYDEPETVQTLARVHGWLAKAARPDMTDAGRQACVLLALDEISAAPDARQRREAA